jgi:hypothetical protein
MIRILLPTYNKIEHDLPSLLVDDLLVTSSLIFFLIPRISGLKFSRALLQEQSHKKYFQLDLLVIMTGLSKWYIYTFKLLFSIKIKELKKNSQFLLEQIYSDHVQVIFLENEVFRTSSSESIKYPLLTHIISFIPKS